jgi:DNA-directed RNA polymerase subunit L
MKFAHAVFIIAINITVLPNVFAEELSAKDIEKEIKKSGPKEVCASLYEDVNKWYELQGNIASGNQEWLKIAGSLRAGSDAEASEMLSLSVGEALEHNPEDVFKHTLGSFTTSEICGAPDVEDVRYDSHERSIEAINRRVLKVSSVQDVNLLDERIECLQRLAEAREGLAELFQSDEQSPASTEPAASNEMEEGEVVEGEGGVDEGDGVEAN